MKIANYIVDYLKSGGYFLSVAESCSGGLLAYEFSKISGASEVFLGGVVSYSNSLKSKILGVSAESLAEFSPYSVQVVEQMLNGAIKLGANYAIAISGVAGPNGGSDENPVGSVYIGVKKAESSVDSRICENMQSIEFERDFSDDYDDYIVKMWQGVGVKIVKFHFSGEREVVQQKAVESALNLLWDFIIKA